MTKEKKIPFIEFYRDGAGLFSFTVLERYNFHFGVEKESRRWGYCGDAEITLPVVVKEFGLGPILLFCWYGSDL